MAAEDAALEGPDPRLARNTELNIEMQSRVEPSSASIRGADWNRFARRIHQSTYRHASNRS